MSLFHPSSLGLIMTEPKLKSEKLSETCKKHLIEVYVYENYGRRKELDNKWVNKGNEVEGESIRMYNVIHGTNYAKNTETFANDFIIGTPDVKDDIILEAKSSYDIFTFLNAKHSKLDKDYYWQCMGYSWLTGLKESKLFYALSNTPCEILQDEKRKLAWKMKCIEDESEEYIQKCKMLERLAIYDMELFKFHYPYFDFHSNPATWKFDIPMTERLHVITIPYDQSAIDKLKQRIDDCNEYMEKELFQSIPERIDIEQL